jgi:hypothetical protein
LIGRPREEPELDEERESWCEGLLTPLLSLVYLTTYTLHLVLSEKFQLGEFQILLGNPPAHAFYTFFFRLKCNLRSNCKRMGAGGN